MIDYPIPFNKIVQYNGVWFHMTRISPSYQKHTIKQITGLEVMERPVFGSNTLDTVLSVNGLLAGSVNGSGIKVRWDALWASRTGQPYVYSDGNFSGSYVIRPQGLRPDFDPVNVSEILFSIELVEW